MNERAPSESRDYYAIVEGGRYSVGKDVLGLMVSATRARRPATCVLCDVKLYWYRHTEEKFVFEVQRYVHSITVSGYSFIRPNRYYSQMLFKRASFVHSLARSHAC